MAIFHPGVVLPFDKGQAPLNPIEDYTPTGAVRVPLVRLDDDASIPTLPFEENAPLDAGCVLYQEPNELPVLSPIAATFGGTVVLQHPQYGKLLCAELIPGDGGDRRLPIHEHELTAEDILNVAREAAIYDELDGIPLVEKLTVWQLPPNDLAAPRCVLVADATENDVYGSSAWGVLAAEPETALAGLQLAAKAARFTRYHIATLLPKAQRRALKHAVDPINVYTVDDEYPVTRYADNRDEVFRIGIQACLALAKAIQEGRKALSVVVTVAGNGVTHTRNLRVPYGTDIGEILRHCGAREDCTVVLGDAMTGVACPDARVPLLPGTTALLALRMRAASAPQPCIGCGRCATVCHAGLLPYEIVRRAENMHYTRLRRLHAHQCDGCGACSYICPSGLDVALGVLRAGENAGPVFLNWGDEDDE